MKTWIVLFLTFSLFSSVQADERTRQAVAAGLKGLGEGIEKYAMISALSSGKFILVTVLLPDTDDLMVESDTVGVRFLLLKFDTSNGKTWKYQPGGEEQDEGWVEIKQVRGP